MKNLFLTAACLVAFALSGMAQPFPINTNSSNYHKTVDVKTFRGYIYVLATFGNSTTFRNGLTITTGSHDLGYYVAKYSTSGTLVWVNHSYSTASPAQDHIAVDFEIKNGRIHVLVERDPTASTGSFNVQTVSGPPSTVLSSLLGLPGTQRHHIIAIETGSGTIINGGGVTTVSSIPGASSMVGVTLEGYTIENLGNDSTVLIGGRNSSVLGDGFIGRFTWRSGNYEPAIVAGANDNYTNTIGGSSNNNMVLDLETNPSNTWVFATGIFDATGPMGSGLTTSGPNDAFVMAYDPFDLTPTPNGESSAVTAGEGSGNAIDVASINQVGNDLDIAIAGDAEGDITNWGPTTNTINNAFVTRLNFNTATNTFSHQWTNVLDYAGQVQDASGTGVVFSELQIHASGVFDGNNFDVFGGGCPQPGAPGTLSGFQVGFDRFGGSCINSGTTQSFFPGHTAVDIAFESNIVYVTGDYEEEFTMNIPSGIPPTHMHPLPGTPENYLVRFDVPSGNYFKNGSTTSVEELAAEDEAVFTLAPNPSKGILNITQSISENTRLRITDMNGRVVFEQLLEGAQSTVNLGHLAKGIYLVDMSSEGVSDRQKLVLE